MRAFVLAIAALLAARPLFAQNRIGKIGDGASGASGASVNGGLAGLSAPALSIPTPVSLNSSLTTPVSALPKEEAVRATIEALSPDKIGQISGESAKILSGRLLGLEEERARAPASSVEGSFSARAPNLAPSKPNEIERVREQRAIEPSRPTYGFRQNAVDSFHYVRLLAQNYYWYSVTHIVNMWPSYKKRWEEAKARGAANVSRPREFFAYMRVAATSGRFYVLGAEPIEDDAMAARFREDLVEWYDVPGAIDWKEIAAFDSFMARAKGYNSERRAPSNMRKHIRDALLKGSTMEPSKLAEFFDSLLVEKTARETSDFQSQGGQKRILDAFKKELLDTLAEEPVGAKGRVRAAILLGSFATGSAGPNSDFDIEVLTDGGSSARVAAFIKRLTGRWIATGHHARNPVSVHEFPSIPTRGVVDRVHSGNYLVVSLDSELAARLQRRPGEYAVRRMRADSLRGKVNRAVQYGVIVAATYLGELKARFGSSSSGH